MLCDSLALKKKKDNVRYDRCMGGTRSTVETSLRRDVLCKITAKPVVRDIVSNGHDQLMHF